jgi:hypothetical protein
MREQGGLSDRVARMATGGVRMAVGEQEQVQAPGIGAGRARLKRCRVVEFVAPAARRDTAARMLVVAASGAHERVLVAWFCTRVCGRQGFGKIRSMEESP